MPRSSIDREKQSTCQFKVLVKDNVGHTCYSDVYVKILDKNDNKPVFSQSNYVIPVRENASVSAMLIRVQAHDLDKGANRKISYRLESSSADMFSIQRTTGIILLEKPLRKNQKRNHTLNIEAVDDGNPALSSAATVTIVVLGESDRPPEFTKSFYVFPVSEGLELGGTIGTVQAIKNAGSKQGGIQFELITGDNSMFNLEKRSGRLMLLKNLDREITKTITLSIRARYTNVPTLSSVVSVTIQVLDENDNPPVFSKKAYQASIDENVRRGSFVLQVFAEDKDEGENGRVSYRLVKSGENVPFKINKQTGIVTTSGKAAIDREVKERYEIKIRAFDSGTPSRFSDVCVNITIADLNDNPPDILPQNATVIVQEGSETVVFSWTASDRDTVKNGPPFTYTIIKGNKTLFKVVDESDIKGSLIARGSLRVADKAKHHLVIRVTDNGSPPQSSLCYLTIHVVKQSIAKPEILEPTMFFLVVKKPQELVTVGRIRVTDKDKGELHQFKIAAGNDDNTFAIETFSGLITGRPKKGMYTISVEVFDGEYTVSATISIIVNTITEDLYENSVIITALDISADNFVHDKMRDFANHIRYITSAEIENIIIWAVQTKDTKRKARDVDTRTDTEVVFAVRKTNEVCISFFFNFLARMKFLLDYPLVLDFVL